MPQFVKCLEDVEVVDGQEVMLFCVVTGKPMPTVTWYHNNQNIAKNEEYVFTCDRQTGHVYLVILDCLADDEGEFRCVATNAAGQAVTKCKLRILPGDISKPLSPAEQLLSPARQPLSPPGQPLNRGGQPLGPVGPPLCPVGPPLLIKVTSAERDTVSKMSAVRPTASQSRQTQLTSTMVTSTVSDTAAINGHLPSAESLTLTPPDILFHTKKIPGQSRKVASYRTVLRRASDNDLLGYRPKSTDQPPRQNLSSWKVSDWSVYAKGTVQPVERVPETQLKMPAESKLPRTYGSLQPTILSAPTALQPTSTESDAHIVSSSSKSLLFSQPAKVPHAKAPAETSAPFTSSRLFEPPRFTLSLPNQTIRDGDAAALRVRFHGNPMPKLRWFFNRKAVMDEEDFVIHTDYVKGESVLWIKEVFPEDDGDFTCKAENDYGSAVTHCRLTVQCKCRNSCYACSVM